MELKWQKTWRRRVRHSVLIAPLWNWNGDLVYIHGSLRIVLIAPLWNWNFQAKEIRRSLELVLIAPLWNWNYIETVIPDKADNRSNRTFMELKFNKLSLISHYCPVLIAPLWNWNPKSVNFFLVLFSSNRTFMELKWWFWGIVCSSY